MEGYSQASCTRRKEIVQSFKRLYFKNGFLTSHAVIGLFAVFLFGYTLALNLSTPAPNNSGVAHTEQVGVQR